MIGQIVPRIFNGEAKLIFTESVCFLPADGLQIKLPVNNPTQFQKEITINFSFQSIEGKEAAITEFIAEGDQLRLTLVNFNGSLGVGTTTPVDFKIGLDTYQLLFFVQGLANHDDKTKQLLKMTISMYFVGV